MYPTFLYLALYCVLLIYTGQLHSANFKFPRHPSLSSPPFPPPHPPIATIQLEALKLCRLHEDYVASEEVKHRLSFPQEPVNQAVTGGTGPLHKALGHSLHADARGCAPVKFSHPNSAGPQRAYKSTANGNYVLSSVC